MDDEVRDTPPTVIGAIAAGVAPVPFLLTYAVIFLAHGTLFPVDPPDITTTRGGEALAGLAVLVILVAIVLGLGWLLSGRTRWVFLIGQAVVLVACLRLLLDSSSGRAQVPLLLLATSLMAMVLACLGPSWRWAAAAPPRSPAQAIPGDPDPAARA